MGCFCVKNSEKIEEIITGNVPYTNTNLDTQESNSKRYLISLILGQKTLLTVQKLYYKQKAKKSTVKYFTIVTKMGFSDKILTNRKMRIYRKIRLY